MTKWLIGLALVTAVAVAGCGGNGGGSRLTKEDFIAQADAICTEAQAKEDKVDFPTVSPDSATNDDLDQLAEAIEQATAINRDEIKELKDLTPPEDFDEEFSESLRELTEGLDHADSAVDEARKHDKDGLTRELAAVEAKANEANERARNYGLKVCGGTA